MSYRACARYFGKFEECCGGERPQWWNKDILGQANLVMASQWAELFVHFATQIDEARKSINQKLTELHDKLCRVYNPNTRVYCSVLLKCVLDLRVSQTLIVMFKLKQRDLMHLLEEETGETEETSRLWEDFRHASTLSKLIGRLTSRQNPRI